MIFSLYCAHFNFCIFSHSAVISQLFINSYKKFHMINFTNNVDSSEISKLKVLQDTFTINTIIN